MLVGEVENRVAGHCQPTVAHEQNSDVAIDLLHRAPGALQLGVPKVSTSSMLPVLPHGPRIPGRFDGTAHGSP